MTGINLILNFSSKRNIVCYKNARTVYIKFSTVNTVTRRYTNARTGERVVFYMHFRVCVCLVYISFHCIFITLPLKMLQSMIFVTF